MKLRPPLLLFAFISIFAFSGCSRESPDAGVVLQRGLPADPESLDHHKARSTQAADVLRDVGEGLVAYSANGELVPAAAERWETSDDGLSYTFYLRPDARWSNGEAVTAAHFVFGMRRLVSPPTAAFYANLLRAVVNAPDIVAGDKPPGSLGVEAVDDLTLTVRLERPTPYILSLFSHPATFPLHPGAFVEHGDGFARPKNLVSNGAFVLDAWVPGSIIALRTGRLREGLILIGMALAYQAPYALAFSSGTYHFPVMGLLFPLAALNGTRRWRDAPPFGQGERGVFWTVAALLVLVQIEYGYHAATMVTPG